MYLVFFHDKHSRKYFLNVILKNHCCRAGLKNLSVFDCWDVFFVTEPLTLVKSRDTPHLVSNHHLRIFHGKSDWIFHVYWTEPQYMFCFHTGCLRKKFLSEFHSKYIYRANLLGQPPGQALTGTRYPTLPGLFFYYPYPTRKFSKNFRVQGSITTSN